MARAGWPKFAQSAVLWQASAQAIVIASLLPLNATVAQASNASVRIATAYRLPSIGLWSPAALRTAIRYEGVPPLHASLYLSLYLSLYISVYLSVSLSRHSSYSHLMKRRLHRRRYPFGDVANITVQSTSKTTLKIRIPRWATSATVNSQPAANGTRCTDQVSDHATHLITRFQK